MAKKKRERRNRPSVKNRLPVHRANANVVAIRQGDNIVFGMRTGLFGHPNTTVLRIPDETTVGAIEDISELGAVCTQVGMLVLASLFNYNLAFGADGLANKMAEWAGIDVEALKKAAEEEAATVTEEVDEDGDVVVRTAEEVSDGDQG
jgi:hypothetical protein